MRCVVLTCLLLVGGIPAGANALLKPIPVETFAALPTLTDPVLSRDGQKIAALALVGGKQQLAILSADNPGVVERNITLGEAEVTDINWAGRNRLLLTVAVTEELPGHIKLPLLRLIGIDVDTGASRILDGKSRGIYTGDVLFASADGAWAIVSSQDDLYAYPSVKRVDLGTGQAVTIEKARDGVWDWYADEEGVVRAGVAYEGRKWTLWYRDKAEEKLRKIRGKIKDDKESTVDRFIFRGESNWVVSNEKTGRFALYQYDLKTGEIGQPIFEHQSSDLNNVLYDPGTGKVLAVEYEDDRRRQTWFEPELKMLQAKFDKALPQTVNHPVDMSDDKTRILVRSEGASDPGRYFLLNRKSGRMHAVVDPFPQIDPAQLATTKWVEYRARDGLAIRAYLTLPLGRDPKGLPLIVLPHGGPYERDHWEYDPIVQLLANRGYAVLQPQFRGSTGFGRDFVSKGYGQWGLAMQDDLDDGLAWLAKSGVADPKRVCIMGYSYGGYAALWASVRNPDLYRCAISFAGVSDLPKQIQSNKRIFAATRYFKEWRSKIDGEGTRDLDKFSPLNFAEKVGIPVLIGHGEKDTTVAPKQSRAMVDALQRRGAAVESVFYPDAVHGFTKSEDQADWFRRVEAFLRRYNPS